jgi:hypothetical protein
MTNRSISEFSPARSSAPPLLSAFSLRLHLGHLRVAVPRSSSSAGGRKPSTSNCEPRALSARATAPLRLVPTPGFTTTLSINVGAPTYCTSFATGASTFKSGPPKKDGSYSICELSTVNCVQDSPKRVFYRGIIKHVGAPTCFTTNTKSQHPPASEGGRYKKLGIRRRMPILSEQHESKDLSRHSPLSLIIPAHPRSSPVSPIIPALTQNRGVGVFFLQHTSSSNSFVFFRHVNYSII